MTSFGAARTQNTAECAIKANFGEVIMCNNVLWFYKIDPQLGITLKINYLTSCGG